MITTIIKTSRKAGIVLQSRKIENQPAGTFLGSESRRSIEKKQWL